MSNSSPQTTYSITSTNLCNEITLGPTNTVSIDSSLFAPSSGVYSYVTGYQPYVFQNGKGVEVAKIASDEATLEVTGRIKINGEFLDDRLERIETLLSIPTRDVTIEQQYPKLRELYETYMKELEKYKTWNRLTKGTEK